MIDRQNYNTLWNKLYNKSATNQSMSTENLQQFVQHEACNGSVT